MADNRRIEELKRRVQSDPASIAFAALAEEYRRAGQYDEAIATCKAGLQRHPAYLSAHVTLGRALIEVNRFDEAREELEHVLKIAPENLAAIRGLAEIHHRRGEHPDEQHDHAALDAGGTEAAARDATSSRAAPVQPVAPQPAVRPPAQATPAAPVSQKPIPVPPAAPSAPAQAASVPAAPPASAAPTPVQPIRMQSAEAPAPIDPALAELEAFLAAILRARDALETAAPDRQ